LNVTIPEELSEEEALEVLEESLAEVLGVHPSQIELTVDEFGNVEYVITTDTFVEADDLQKSIDATTFVDELNNKVQEEIPEFIIDDVDSNEEIEVEVDITVDATDVDDEAKENAKEALTDLANDLDLEEPVIEEFFLTAAPTKVPSEIPTTSIPSATPTITGSVIVISLTDEDVTEELSASEIERLTDIVIDSYGLDENDPITTTVDYTTTGTMTIEGTTELTPEELEILEDTMENTLSEILGVPSEDIELEIDPETGVVSYTISSPSFNTTAEILEQMTAPEFVEEFTNELTKDLETADTTINAELISVSSIEPVEEIAAEIIIVIDEDDVTKSQILAENTVDVLVGEEYEVQSEVQFITSAPTVMPTTTPSLMPTTILPTQAPSITGDVSIVEITKPVTESLTTEEVEEIIKQAEE
jgi:phenylpyruvate tautomerase PptA (4-oxalocrotonate tautomerase family)